MYKKILFFSFFILFAVSPIIKSCTPDIINVYICDSVGAKRYHRVKHCNGLNNCSHIINKLNISNAKKIGRTPCKICY